MSKNFVDRLMKKFKDEDVIRLSDKDDFKSMKSWVSMGSGELDTNLSTLGFPVGIVEVAGASRSGKTTLALHGMKNFQIQYPDGICCILSSENRDSKDYAEKMGIDTNRIIIMKIRYVEKMFLMVKNLIDETMEMFDEEKIPRSKARFYFMWDSLGATLSKSELDTMDENTNTLSKKMEKGDEMTELKHEKIGAFAKPAKMFAKYLTSEMYDKVIHFIILNHQYDKIGGHGKKSPGGEWVEYMPTLRLDTRLKEHIKIDDEQVAQITVVSVVKNDFGTRTKTEIEILLGFGIVLSETDIEFAVEEGIIKKEGVKKMSFLEGKLVWSTKREFYEHFKRGNPLMKLLQKKITQAWHNKLLKEKG